MSDSPPDIVHASEIVASAVFLFAMMGTGAVSVYVVGRWARLGRRATGLLRDSRRARTAASALLVSGLAAAAWAWLVEPRTLRVFTLRVESEKLALEPGRALRLVFVSDLHVEPGWRMEGRLARRVAELAPDAVLLGGDYLNAADPGSLAMLSDAARSLADVAPVYAVTGNVDAYRKGMGRLLESVGARVVEGGAAEIAGGATVFGVGYLDAGGVERAGAASDAGRYRICLTHAPGIIPEAARAGFDLYLCGHTHGGQVRLPLWGALITLSVHGKRFESGRYDVGGMTVYVTRGVGLEGGRLVPRVRFLCAPEVVVVELARPQG